jgi:hypothetical protein
MCGLYRQHLIAEHRFYVEQAHKRLLSQFDNIHDEAEQAEKEFLDSMSQHFDPDRHDPADFYEAAHDKSIEFYQLLNDMHGRTRLSVVAGMYHEWDKKLREWMAREMRNWCASAAVIKALWLPDIARVFDLLASFGWDVKTSIPNFDKLNAMRLVVNVFKHGEGSSFDELKKSYPEYLNHALSDEAREVISLDWLDHSFMTITDVHVEEFSGAVLEFWLTVPENLYLRDDIELPKWIEKAFNKDKA